MDAAVTKYLARYAEREIELARSVGGSYGAALIVPACRESITLLDGYRAAAEALDERLLVILVVNAAADAGPSTHAENERLLRELAARYSAAERLSDGSSLPPAWRGRDEVFDVLWLDRATSRHRLPEQQGVGLARKVGTDLALALHAAGKLRVPWLFGSDADAELPRDYFACSTASGVAALLFPFTHVPSGDTEVDVATEHYEVSLRYYTLGLGWAGSPYAYHSIGSTFAVDAQSYAKVRGFPKRTAGEDFYLLDKLAKIGPIERVETEPVRIASRRSDRVPFGTGRKVAEIAAATAAGSEQRLYHPEVFAGLNAWLSALERFVAHRDLSGLREDLAGARGSLGPRVLRAVEAAGAFDELALAIRQSPRAEVLRRRVHTWFDALRTLRFVHALRDSGSVALPFREALATAPFTAGVDVTSSPRELTVALAALEKRLPRRTGVTV